MKLKPEKITIRKATLKDVSVILEMWKEFMAEHDSDANKNPRLRPHTAHKKEAPAIMRRYLRKNIKSGKSLELIAFCGKRPAGYNMNTIKKNIPVFQTERIGYIGDLYVRKEFRGLKISSMFRDHAIEWFRKKGIRHIAINVRDYNMKAHAIYKKWEFFDFGIELRKNI